jgi:Lon protease-like protein
MPRAHLPILISGPDYYDVASEVFENNIVAIVQPKPAFVKADAVNEPLQSFKTGCAGKITSVSYVDGDVAVNIRGVCRFDIVEELQPDVSGIERVLVSYDKYSVDMDDAFMAVDVDKSRLVSALDLYFESLEISPNWKEIEQAPVDTLVSAIAMACPLHPSEKQSLLETVDIKERSDMMTRIIEMNSMDKLNAANTVN